MKVGVVGMGSVGASVAVSTLHAGIASALWVSDLRRERAEGEAMDLAHGAPFYPPCDVRAVSVDDALGCDVVVVAAGKAGSPTQTRIDLLRENAKVARDIGARLHGSQAIVIAVTNPVDVFTRLLVESSGLDPSRVLGTGTMLDSARLRRAIGDVIHVEPRSIHAQIVGEHGDTEVVLWSSAHVGGAPLATVPGWKRSNEARIAAEVRGAAYEIIQRKGMTNHAIGVVTAALVRCVARDERRVLTVSRVHQRFDGVALSLPAVVGREGVTTLIEPATSDEERAALEKSARFLAEAHRSIATA